MSNPRLVITRRFRGAVLLALATVLSGCGSPDAQFRLNRVYAKFKEEAVGEEFTKEQLQDVATTLAVLFRTSDEPFIFRDAELGTDEVLNIELIRLAAGPVGSDEDGRPRGLYRKHCVHCHGITGDGAGPTAAFLNPYPRDYRRGIFKFKSTPIGYKPTHEDLRKVLITGITGTAMPSFRVLDNDEIDALVHYVKYLSIRGEVERSLIDDSSELEISEDDPSENERLETSREYLLEEKLATVLDKWRSAESRVTEIPPRPDWNEQESLVAARHGRELYFGTVANCVKCHGNTQLGDGQTNDFDSWWKELELTTKNNPKLLSTYLAMGALPPRNSRPRNLRQGVFRGGRRPIDIYWRILNGIDGTPMPAASLKTEGNPNGLTEEDIWHLVEYVRNYLPYESLSRPLEHSRTNKRERL